jgi:prepilin signal peptidase PulO-like enzyme (type II secretory pathway)
VPGASLLDSMPAEETAAALESGPAAPGGSAADGPLLRPLAVAPFVAGVIALAFATLSLDRAILAAFTSAVLVVLAAIDIERRIIPNRIVLPATGVVLVLQVTLFTGRALESALAAIIAAVVLMLPQLLGRSWMGMGDVKLALLLGAALGWGVLGAVLLGFLCTFPVSVVILIRGGMGARRTMIPFGPFLALGALIVLFLPHLLGLPTN